jgi:hypothetical protein
VFSNPGPGEVGNLGRRAFTGPGIYTFDLGLIKRTQITETVNLQFRAEMFNALNHPIFFIADDDINSSFFGRITSTLTEPRVVQLALKIEF